MRRPSSVRELFTQGLLLIILILAFYPAVLQGRLLAPGEFLYGIPPWQDNVTDDMNVWQNPLMPDVITAFYPYYYATQFALDDNQWPLWNPYEFSGMPLMANCQSAEFYPPRLLHLFFGVKWGTSLYILLKLWLCGMTAYLCGRGIGLNVWISRLFSVTWALCAYNVIWSYWSLPDVSAWLPVLFLGSEWIARQRYRQGFFLVLLGGSMMLFAGHPETAFTMTVGLGVYFLVRLVLEGKGIGTIGKGLACFGAAWGAVLLVCAVQLLPFLEYLSHSHTAQARVEEKVSVGGFSPDALAALWVPRFFGTKAEGNFWGAVNSNLSSMVYSGIMAWIGISTLLVRPRLSTPFRRMVWALAASGVFVSLVAFQAPGFSVLLLVPPLNMALPEYSIVFLAFVVPLLGCIGWQHWFAYRRPFSSLTWLMIVPACILLVIVGGHVLSYKLLAMMKMTAYVHRQYIIAASFACAGAAIVVVAMRLKRHGVLCGTLIVLTAGDLWLATCGLNPSCEPENLYKPTALTDFLESVEHPTRFVELDSGIPSGMLVPYRIAIPTAYDGLYPDRIYAVLKGLKEANWQPSGACYSNEYYLVWPEIPSGTGADFEDHDRFEHITTLNEIEVYRDRAAYPRAYLAGHIQELPSKEALFDTMKQDGYHPEQTVLVVSDDVPSKPWPNQDSETLGSAVISRYTTQEVVVAVEAEEDCVLVLADAYFPGWRVKIDGASAELFAAYYAVRGVIVPKGKHEVLFTYDPLSLRVGLIISIIALLGSMGLALIWKRGSVNDKPLEDVELRT